MRSPSLFPLLRRGIHFLGYEPEMFPPIQYTRRLLRLLGLEIRRFGPLCISWNLKRVFAERRVDFLLDVGGNRGQFGLQMRELGFRGTIHSFEPLPDVRDTLMVLAARDGNWEVHDLALSSESGKSLFNVGQFDQTSSLKFVDPLELTTNPALNVVRQIEVDVSTVDDFICDYGISPERTFLKIDVQGSEIDVLKGSKESLKHFPVVLTETALTPAYQHGGCVEELLDLLRNYELDIAGIEPVYANPSRRLLMEIDVLAMRRPRS